MNRTNGREYRKSTCKECDNLLRRTRTLNKQEKSGHRRRVDALEGYEQRKDPLLRYKFAYKSARASDKRKGWENDLTKEIVQSILSSGCRYCGENDQVQMTLDRIDNSLPHLISNCAPACRRCNYFRRDMPYLAWLEIAPVMRKLRELGELEGWDCFSRWGRTERKYQ